MTCRFRLTVLTVFLLWSAPSNAQSEREPGQPKKPAGLSVAAQNMLQGNLALKLRSDVSAVLALVKALKVQQVSYKKDGSTVEEARWALGLADGDCEEGMWTDAKQALEALKRFERDNAILTRLLHARTERTYDDEDSSNYEFDMKQERNLWRVGDVANDAILALEKPSVAKQPDQAVCKVATEFKISDKVYDDLAYDASRSLTEKEALALAAADEAERKAEEARGKAWEEERKRQQATIDRVEAEKKKKTEAEVERYLNTPK